MKGILGLSASAIGVLAGLTIGIAASAIGGSLEGLLGITIVSWEMAGLIVTMLAALGGGVMGGIGRMLASPLFGAVTGGLVLSGAFAGVALTNGCPHGVAVWTIVVGLLTGVAAGSCGGWIGQRGRAVRTGSQTKNVS